MVMSDIFGIKEAIQGILISLVSAVYNLVSYVYQIFLALAETNIFEQTEYQFLVEKVYVLLGVLVLFVIAYNMLIFIVDPDKNKSGAEVEKLIKKVFISFILIIMCPTIFNYAFKIQNAILSQHIFENFFSKTGTSESDDSLKTGGTTMAGSVFEAFFVGNEEYGGDSSIESEEECKPYQNSKCFLNQAKEWVKTGRVEGDSKIFGGKYRVFKAFAGNIVKDQIEFSWFISLIAGGYLLYVILSFCFDLALRVIKLAFYQIIAPICIGCQNIPNRESIFTNWWKAAFKTYVSVFIRVFIMNLSVYLLDVVTNNRSTLFDMVGKKGENSAGIRVFAFALLILGIVTFMKQASKLIDEIFGLGDVKLGIKDKLKEGTSPITNFADKTARVGFGAAGLVRGFQHGHGNPLAAIRAARTNYQNRNLSGNEAELNRRREFDNALANGATRRQLFGDYVRQKLGMPTKQTVADRDIEDIEYINDRDGNRLTYSSVVETDANGNATGRDRLIIVDSSGNEVKDVGIVDASNSSLIGQEVRFNTEFKNTLEVEQQDVDRQIKEIDDATRRIQEINSQNQSTNNHGNAMESRAESKLREAKNNNIMDSFFYTTKDENGYTVVRTVTGNLQAMETQVSELLKDSSIDQAERSKIQSEFSKAKERMLHAYMDSAQRASLVDTTDINALRAMVNTGLYIDLDGNQVVTAADIQGLNDDQVRDKIKSSLSKVCQNVSSVNIDDLKDRIEAGVFSGYVGPNGQPLITAADIAGKSDEDIRSIVSQRLSFVSDGNISSELQQLQHDVSSGMFRDLDGNVDISSNDIQGMTASEIREKVKSRAGAINGDASVLVNDNNRNKSRLDHRIKDIEEVKRLHENTQQQEKRTDGYRAVSASATYAGKNPNETKHGGGSSGSSK